MQWELDQQEVVVASQAEAEAANQVVAELSHGGVVAEIGVTVVSDTGFGRSAGLALV